MRIRKGTGDLSGYVIISNRARAISAAEIVAGVVIGILIMAVVWGIAP